MLLKNWQKKWDISIMDRKAIKFRISPREQEIEGAYINALYLPWQNVDIISSNCPKHAGVRLNRLDDEVFQCPYGKEIYKPHGSVNIQTSRDNYYTGMILK